MKRLSEVADTYPHGDYAAYAAFIHGLFSRWSYIMQIIPDIQEHLATTTGGCNSSTFYSSSFWSTSVERDLYALPVQPIVNPCKVLHSNFMASEQLTSPFVALITAHTMCDSNCRA